MIPDYQTRMRPVLELAVSGGEISIRDAVRAVEDRFELTEGDRATLLPSGKQRVIANRVHWAKTYLKQAGLLSNPKRGYFQITPAGQDALASGEVINNRYLKQFDAFLVFQGRGTSPKPQPATEGPAPTGEAEETPEEAIERAHMQLSEALARELLDRLRESDPSFFEHAIVKLLLKMGYGSDRMAGRVVGQAGDDGVDGVINQDELGVDQVYIQAKRYAADNAIGSAAIRDFYGALGLKDVSRGIFVTTSSFSHKARETAEKLGARIVLVDGPRLAELMIRHSVGIRLKDSFAVSELDDGFFE